MKKQLLLGFVLASCLSYPALSQTQGRVAPGAVVPPPAEGAGTGGGGVIIDPPLVVYCAENVSNYQARADSVQALLDKTQVPTGILYDRVSRSAGLVGFNATAPDTSDFGHFRQAIYDLHASAYNTRILPCQRDVRDYAQLRLDRDTVAIGVLHYRFNYLDSTAVASNLLYYDTKRHQRAGPTARRAWAASLALPDAGSNRGGACENAALWGRHLPPRPGAVFHQHRAHPQ